MGGVALTKYREKFCVTKVCTDLFDLPTHGDFNINCFPLTWMQLVIYGMGPAGAAGATTHNNLQLFCNCFATVSGGTPYMVLATL